MKLLSSLLFLQLILLCPAHAQELTVYPTNWWVGFKNPNLQLMIHRDSIANEKISLQPYPGVKMLDQKKVENPNYIFIDLQIAKTTLPGKLKFSISGNRSRKVQVLEYVLRSRNHEDGKTRIQGVTAKDLVYLLIPDRFANGDTSNDVVKGYRDETSDRKDKFLRHGGDFKGIEDHFDYFHELGVTTLWLTPVIENDMPLMNEWGNHVAGYHGYWFTDHYQVDKRLGGNDGYKELCDEAHQKGLKVIQDAVYNHVGIHHWFVIDPPMHDWLNTWPAFQGTNHREETLFDPYASDYDKKIMLNGWFVPHLPDLNQRNPYVANFLIQHAIWSTEEFGIDGWRVDTYKYCDEQFLNNVNAALGREFPGITVFGEAAVNTEIGNAYFTRNKIQSSFRSNALGVLDFEMHDAMLSAMNDTMSWTGGVNHLYMTLAQDVVYQDPMHNCIFLDNHDQDRVYSTVKEDWAKLKMGINWLFTLRGIPQLYYGTEVLMKNKKDGSDAPVREDFPGGWKGDKENRFIKEGRTDSQNVAFDYISALANFRKNSTAITSGKTMQYLPKAGMYVYFRYDSHQTIMVIANTGNDQSPDWNVFSERVKGFSKMRNAVTGEVRSLAGFSIAKGESFVFELLP